MYLVFDDQVAVVFYEFQPIKTTYPKNFAQSF